jgi:hypothetical protein
MLLDYMVVNSKIFRKWSFLIYLTLSCIDLSLNLEFFYDIKENIIIKTQNRVIELL